MWLQGVESSGGGVLIGVARLDWKRVGTAGLFGAAFVGPVGHFWSPILLSKLIILV